MKKLFYKMLVKDFMDKLDDKNKNWIWFDTINDKIKLFKYYPTENEIKKTSGFHYNFSIEELKYLRFVSGIDNLGNAYSIIKEFGEENPKLKNIAIQFAKIVDDLIEFLNSEPLIKKGKS